MNDKKMNSSTIIPILICIVIPGYWLWRYHVAINAREKVCQDVDTFLGRDDIPEELKSIVYNAFIESLHHFLIIAITRVYFKKEYTQVLPKLKEKYGEKNMIDTMSLIVKLMIVNSKLSPILYLFTGFTFFISSLNKKIKLKTTAFRKLFSNENYVQSAFVYASK